jgi:hypothetical protein
MSTDASQRDADGPGVEKVPPLAADRPFVDGTAASSEELRAEVERLTDEDRQHVDELREELGDSVAALAEKLDVGARVRARKDEALVAVQERATAAREKPGAVAALTAVVALLVLLVVLLRRRRR